MARQQNGPYHKRRKNPDERSPFTERFTILLTVEQFDAINKAANQRRCNRSQIVRDLIEDYVISDAGTICPNCGDNKHADEPACLQCMAEAVAEVKS